MSRFLDILKFVTTHPLTRDRKSRALLRFLGWQLGSRLLNAPFLFPFVNDTQLVTQKGVHSGTGNYYVGLMSFEEMSFLLHFLREEDVFVDVGANIGAFSVLASGVCGARSFAFEPAKASYEWMIMNLKLNNLEDRVVASRSAVGAEIQVIKFVENEDSVINHVLEPGESTSNVVDVKVVNLDNALLRQQPTLMKIDVEGFETMVFDGASEVLNRKSLKALIVEIKGHGTRYGFDEAELFHRIIDLGFTPCSYDPLNRTLKKLPPSFENHDPRHEIYCRDLDYVQARVANAAPFRVLDKSV